MRAVRWQPPVYSPLPSGAAWHSLLLGASVAGDPRRRVTRTLLQAFGAEAAVLCGSGTEALQLALRVAHRLRGAGAIVAVPAFTCFGVATAVVGADARVALYDVDPATLAPDLDSLRLALREGAQVVVASPLFGVPLDWCALEECTASSGALIIEDAAQGHGATWHDRPLGSLGTLSVLSFGRGKGWTGGQGGALLLRGAPARVVGASFELEGPSPGMRLRVGAQVLAQWMLGRPHLYWIPAALPWLGLGETRYNAPQQPRAMTREAAHLLERTREPAQREAEIRKANAALLLGRIPFGRSVRGVQPPPSASPGFLRLPLRLARGLEGFRTPGRATRLGIAPGYPHPLHILTQIRTRMMHRSEHWPGASALARELVTLPTHSLITCPERDELVGLIGTYES